MPHANPRGTIQFSVDMVPEEFTSLVQHRRFEQRIDNLVSLFDRYGLTATWAVSDVFATPGVDVIRASRGAHRFAALVDPTWFVDGPRRAGLLRGLHQRVVVPRDQGLAIRTLALCDTMLNRDWDLLVKHGIVAVRDQIGRPDVKTRPVPLRFGLWRIPVAMNVAAQGGRTWSGLRGWRMRRRTVVATGHRAVMHFGIDTRDLLTGGKRSLATIERLLHFVRQLVDRGSADVGTMADLADRFAAPREAAPTRSILQAA